jgi:hypothetical protein
MNRFGLSDYMKVECEFKKDPSGKILPGLWRYANGNICETGCGSFRNGKCPGYIELLILKKNRLVEKQGPTNAELAKVLGVTKRQVAKLRRSGELIKRLEKL